MRPGTCVHYPRGGYFTNAQCNAGVSFASVGGDLAVAGFATRLPCIALKIAPTGGAKETCATKRLPTADELAAFEREFAKALDRARLVMTTIAPLRDLCGKRGGAGVIECPVCKGRLHWSIASNGHCHGKCETPDCVSWME